MNLSVKQINALIEGINKNAERENPDSKNNLKSEKANPDWAKKLKQRYKNKEWRNEVKNGNNSRRT